MRTEEIIVTKKVVKEELVDVKKLITFHTGKELLEIALANSEYKDTSKIVSTSDNDFLTTEFKNFNDHYEDITFETLGLLGVLPKYVWTEEMVYTRYNVEMENIYYPDMLGAYRNPPI